MATPLSEPGAGVLDAGALARLRYTAQSHSPEAAKAAATQFEAMLLQMVMKSMRDAAPSEGLFDSEQGRTMQCMLDQQYAQALATRSIGLAEVLANQLAARGGQPAGDHAPAVIQGGLKSTAGAGRKISAAAPMPVPHHAAAVPQMSKQQAFAQRFSALADAASAATGIPAKFMLAQAALESGWGRREIRHADGGQSHNVFGVKAGKGWSGPVADVVTTEFVGGTAQRRVEKFRAYGSYAEAFADYARMLTRSARYSVVLASASDAVGFAQGLQRAGYASDPAYADKLRRVIARV